MKVKELIEQLKQFDPELEVRYYNDSDDMSLSINYVKEEKEDYWRVGKKDNTVIHLQ